MKTNLLIVLLACAAFLGFFMHERPEQSQQILAAVSHYFYPAATPPAPPDISTATTPSQPKAEPPQGPLFITPDSFKQDPHYQTNAVLPEATSNAAPVVPPGVDLPHLP